MWKPVKKEDEAQAPAPSPAPAYPAVPPKEVRPVDTKQENQVAHIGKAVLIKGELSGSEDLYLDGEVEGTIELDRNSVTVGPNARIRAHIHAREVIIHGKVDGNIQGTDRVELRRTAVLVGDISTQRVSIEDGAYFKGGIDIKRDEKAAKPSSSLAASVPAGVGIGAPAMADKK